MLFINAPWYIYMPCLNSYGIHLLKVTQIARFKQERRSGVKSVKISIFKSGFYFFQISSGIESLPFDPVFSSWVNVIKKVPIQNCSKSLKGIYYFFFSKFKCSDFFNKVKSFFCLLAFITLLQLSVGYVILMQVCWYSDRRR